MLTKSEVKKKMLAKLRESGLTEKDAAKLKLTSYTHTEIAREYPTLCKYPVGGFKIGYFDIYGQPIPEFFRYRYLEDSPQVPPNEKHKKYKYMQLGGLAPRAYFSPLLNWRKAIGDKPSAERKIFITEGELKANCAAKHEIPCIGIGGVWNFKAANNALIPDLANIELQDASVMIVYDSDARSNFEILRAENRLAKELLERGANVYIVRLPALKADTKTGLDDFLVAKGRDEFASLANAAEPWDMSRTLHELNEEVVFIHKDATVLELATLQRMAPHTFTQSVYANRICLEIVKAKNKERAVKKPAASEWLKWPMRAEVKSATYLPGAPRITEDGELNTWTGWGLNGNTVKRGNIRPWRNLIDYMFQTAKPEHKKWFEQWLAYPLQHPGVKMNSAAVVWGLVEGTGKSLIGATMARIYGRNFMEIRDHDLINTHNEWAANRQFIMGDEITGGDKRASADRMKSLITQRFININPKFIPVYTIPDCINYYFTSNHPDSFFLSESDRRYFVHEVKSKPESDAFYYEYDRWYRSDEVGALFHYLLQLDLTGFNPNAKAPETESKREMMDMGRSEVAAWVAALKGDNPVMQGQMPLQRALFSTVELFRLYDPTGTGKLRPNGLARELKRAGFERILNGARIQAAGEQQSLWMIKDIESLKRITSEEDVKRRYEKELKWVAAVHTKPKEKY